MIHMTNSAAAGRVVELPNGRMLKVSVHGHVAVADDYDAAVLRTFGFEQTTADEQAAQEAIERKRFAKAMRQAKPIQGAAFDLLGRVMQEKKAEAARTLRKSQAVPRVDLGAILRPKQAPAGA